MGDREPHFRVGVTRRSTLGALGVLGWLRGDGNTG